VNPLTLPPRLLLRALDDLHTLAVAAQRLPSLEAALVERFAALESRADRIEDQLADLLEFGDRIHAQGEALEATAREVVAAGRELVAAFPTIERTAEIGETLAQAVEPLQGAAERLGRIVDRLPGGARSRSQ
jgi:ABC-type transporter Mla subunit MlaD